MTASRFDAIVIGTGQAGPALADRLARHGRRVAVIERGKFGGTCVNAGCIPTKTLVASAYVARTAARAAEYGIELPGPATVDMRRVKARKDEVSAQSRAAVEAWMTGNGRITVYRGHARFTAPHTVVANGETLEAGQVFLNVGGRPSVRGIEGVDRVPYLTSTTILDLDFVPEHLLIVGGSYIGLEFAQMYRRFGARVTLIELGPRLIGREDERVSQEVRAILEREGIEVVLNARCLSIAVTDRGGVAVAIECSGGPPRVEGSHVLLAIGRQPNTDDLGLERAGIETDARGFIVVDDALATSVPGVWALGDCNGRGAFTHTAYNDYEILADNLLEGASRRVTDRIPAHALYIDPPLGRCGMTVAEAKRAGRRLLVGERPMTRVGRAVEKGETQGFMQIAVDADSCAIVGAAILGVGGDEAIHAVLDIMVAKQPYTTLKHAMHIHPTVAELLPTVLGELRRVE
jgi:pyruvate/2-oxoglutarate dehydrogenase complex dihydrolipoamide dehydrogenase (E3) component